MKDTKENQAETFQGQTLAYFAGASPTKKKKFYDFFSPTP
jgi:hypothetical protein